MPNNKLEFEQVEVHFIFNFLLRIKSFGELCSKLGNWVLSQNTIDYQIAPTLRLANRIGEGDEAKYGKELRKDWRTKDGEYCENATIESADHGATFEPLKCKVSNHTRILDNGFGIHSIAVKLAEPGRTYMGIDVHKLYGLTELLADAHYFAKIFSDEHKEGIIPFQIFSDKVAFFSDKNKSEIAPIAKRIDEAVLLPTSCKMDKESSKLIPNQNPYVMTICHVSNENYRKFFNTNGSVKEEYTKEFLALLFRSISAERKDQDTVDFLNADSYDKMVENLNLDYAKKNVDIKTSADQLENLAMDSRVFYNFHPRCCLIVCCSDERNPAFFVIPSIRNIIELTRARWYTGIIVNAFLDNTLEELRKTIAFIDIEFLREIGSLISIYSQFMEDPVVYGFESGSMTHIADLAQQRMWLSYIRDLTSSKFELVKELYNNKKELFFAEKFK